MDRNYWDVWEAAAWFNRAFCFVSYDIGCEKNIIAEILEPFDFGNETGSSQCFEENSVGGNYDNRRFDYRINAEENILEKVNDGFSGNSRVDGAACGNGNALGMDIEHLTQRAEIFSGEKIGYALEFGDRCFNELPTAIKAVGSFALGGGYSAEAVFDNNSAYDEILGKSFSEASAFDEEGRFNSSIAYKEPVLIGVSARLFGKNCSLTALNFLDGRQSACEALPCQGQFFLESPHTYPMWTGAKVNSLDFLAVENGRDSRLLAVDKNGISGLPVVEGTAGLSDISVGSGMPIAERAVRFSDLSVSLGLSAAAIDARLDLSVGSGVSAVGAERRSLDLPAGSGNRGLFSNGIASGNAGFGNILAVDNAAPVSVLTVGIEKSNIERQNAFLGISVVEQGKSSKFLAVDSAIGFGSRAAEAFEKVKFSAAYGVGFSGLLSDSGEIESSRRTIWDNIKEKISGSKGLCGNLPNIGGACGYSAVGFGYGKNYAAAEGIVSYKSYRELESDYSAAGFGYEKNFATSEGMLPFKSCREFESGYSAVGLGYEKNYAATGKILPFKSCRELESGYSAVGFGYEKNFAAAEGILPFKSCREFESGYSAVGFCYEKNFAAAEGMLPFKSCREFKSGYSAIGLGYGKIYAAAEGILHFKSCWKLESGYSAVGFGYEKNYAAAEGALPFKSYRELENGYSEVGHSGAVISEEELREIKNIVVKDNWVRSAAAEIKIELTGTLGTENLGDVDIELLADRVSEAIGNALNNVSEGVHYL